MCQHLKDSALLGHSSSPIPGLPKGTSARLSCYCAYLGSNPLHSTGCEQGWKASRVVLDLPLFQPQALPLPDRLGVHRIFERIQLPVLTYVRLSSPTLGLPGRELPSVRTNQVLCLLGWEKGCLSICRQCCGSPCGH